MRVLLVEGELVPGTALPSVRRLAMELGVHFKTVAEAYRQLATEGWLDLRHGRSAIVAPRAAPTVVNEAWTEDSRTRMRGPVAQMRARGVSTDSIAEELRAVLPSWERCCMRSRI